METIPLPLQSPLVTISFCLYTNISHKLVTNVFEDTPMKTIKKRIVTAKSMIMNY